MAWTSKFDAALPLSWASLDLLENNSSAFLGSWYTVASNTAAVLSTTDLVSTTEVLHWSFACVPCSWDADSSHVVAVTWNAALLLWWAWSNIVLVSLAWPALWNAHSSNAVAVTLAALFGWWTDGVDGVTTPQPSWDADSSTLMTLLQLAASVVFLAVGLQVESLTLLVVVDADSSELVTLEWNTAVLLGTWTDVEDDSIAVPSVFLASTISNVSAASWTAVVVLWTVSWDVSSAADLLQDADSTVLPT